MTMRITPGMISSRVTADLGRALAALARKQSEISSGHRILAPSDDPGGAAAALTVRSRQAATAEFRNAVADARSSLGTADSALRAIVETVTRARELAVQGGNDSNDAVARRSIAHEVDQLLESLLSSSGSRTPRGAMLFGGQETTTAPYTATRDADGRITAVTPNARGVDGEIAAEVSDGLTVATSIGGSTVFGAATDDDYAFAVLVDLRDALDADDGDAVRATLDRLGSLLDRVTLASTIAGSRLGWLDTIDTRLEDDGLALASSLSRIEDVDMPAAIESLNQIDTFYQAALASGSRILAHSLLDFLR